MENKTLKKLLESLLEVSVYVLDTKYTINELIKKHLLSFESNLISFSYLSSFSETVQKNIFYELIDYFHFHLFAFLYNNSLFVIGPYLKRRYEEKEINKIFIDTKMQMSYLQEFRNIFYQLPIIDTHHIEKTVSSVFKGISDVEAPHYAFQIIRDNDKNKSKCNEKMQNVNVNRSEDIVYKKYELENLFLSNIEHGKVNELRNSFLEIGMISSDEDLSKSIPENMQVGLGSFRTLIRKAAEKSGLSVLIIDEIVNKYTQLMTSTSKMSELTQLATSMAQDLTKEVQFYLIHQKSKHPLIMKINEYIFLNYASEIHIEDLERKFHLSSYYLVHLYKKETGITIHEFIESIRIEKAKDLLINSNLQVNEIATLSGYYDNNYFTKVFKKEENITPIQYRLKNKAE